jgi:cell division transport system permease protein
VKLGYFGFVARRVLKSLRELFWTHAMTSATMGMALFVLGGFLVAQQNLQALLRGWGSQIQIFAYLDARLSPADAKGLLDKVRSYPEVESARYVSRDEAWEIFKAALGGQSGILEGLQPDILPASVEITLRDAHRRRASVDLAAKRLASEGGVAEVEYPQQWVDRLSLLMVGVQWAKWILGGLLFGAVLLIVGSTVKLAIMARKDEVEIMQLVGAPEALVKAPFIIEGMLQGLIGAALAVGLIWTLSYFLSARLAASLGALAGQGQFLFLDLRSMALLAFLGWLMGACGSLMGVRRFLRKWVKS